MKEAAGTPGWHVDQADATAWMEQFKGEVHCIVTDPAYESLEKHRAIGTTTRLKKDWFQIFENSRYPAFFRACYEALVPDAHLYVMCDEETLDVIKPIGRAAGFTYWKAIVWDKMAMGMGYHYRNQHEFIAFFEKGKRKLNDLGVPSVLRVKRVRDAESYPTEKPVDLLRILIEQSTSPGEVVADPFCGSGATGAAATGRVFAGCDISEKAVGLARTRMMKLRGLP